MLVLTRRVGENIVVADSIQIKVVSIKGGRVRLGFTAPASVRIHRQEVNDRAAALAEDPGLDEELAPISSNHFAEPRRMAHV